MSYKIWVFIAIFLFGIGLAFGLTVGLTMPGDIGDFLAEDMAALEQLAAMLQPFQVTTAVFIFLKNASVLLFSFIFSPILCLLPILTLTVNGWLLAFISTIVVEEESIGVVLAGLLPHGIFELPALIIGLAAALSFGAMTIILVLKKESRTVLVATIKKDMGHVVLAVALFFTIGIFHTILIIALMEKQTRDQLMVNLKPNSRYLLIALALLLPAAIIETYVTPLLLA